MNSNPYTVPAIAAAVLLALTVAAWWLCTLYVARPARGRHARGAVPETSPADAPASPDWWDEDPYGDEHPGWWDQEPPPPAVEVITGQGARIAQTSELTLNVLARVRDKLLPAAWQPDEPGEPAFTPADPDVTCTDLAPVTGAPEYLAAPHG